MSPLKTLIVDDSSFYRVFLKRIVEATPSCSYIGSANNGSDALTQIKKLQPDLITLDIEMPVLDGIGVLKALKENNINIPVIVISSVTTSHSQATIAALELGAFDFITKPANQNLEHSSELVKERLELLVTGVSRSTARLARGSVAERSKPMPVLEKIPASHTVKLARKPPKVLVIGISTGGPQALTQLFQGFPERLGIPVLIVQHMPKLFTRSLAESLDKKTSLTVVEAEDGDLLYPDKVYIAPGGYQMKIAGSRSAAKIQITDDDKDEHAKPSVNYLFDSVADVFTGNVLALIMTGLGSDGTRGLTLLKSKGASVLSQDEASCVAYSMPKSAKDAGLVDEEIPLNQLANKVIEYIGL